MRKRNWVALVAGLRCLWSCASETCDANCAAASADETSDSTSTDETDETSTGPGSSGVSSDSDDSGDSTETSGAAPGTDSGDDVAGSNDSADSDATDSVDGSSEAVDEADSGDGIDSNDAVDQADSGDGADSVDDASGDSSEDTTGQGTTSEQTDQTSDAPVGPEDPTSDSSTRLKTVPVGSSDSALGYWEYLPPNYDVAPAPLLVFTHGASWQGDGSDQDLQELLTVGPVNLLSEDRWPNSRPFVVLAPQNSHSGCFTAEDIDGFYRYALETYNIDTTRIYHTGQSCGAIGGWNYLAAHLDEFVTAAVLISGDGQDAFAQAGCDLGRVAIWGLHNEDDGSVSSAGTINPIMDLMTCDPVPDVKLTIYPGATEHDAWTKTYDLSAGNDIYSWLLEHVKHD